MKVRLFYLYCVLVMATIFIAGSFHWQLVKEKNLVLQDIEQKKVFYIPLAENKFTLEFIHSVQKTPVEEIYRVTDDNRLILEATQYYSLGVGLPYTPEDGVFTNENGKFVLTGLKREFSTIPLRVSAIPSHMIIVNDTRRPLLDFVQPGNQLHISAADKYRIKTRKGI